MTIILHEEAENEYFESIGFYEIQEPGLGHRFGEEVTAYIEQIAENPELARQRPGGYRRVNLSIFPHYIAYIVRGNIIWIVAIAHGHRRPEYWKERTTNI